MKIEFKDGVPYKNLSPFVYEAIFEVAKIFTKYNKTLVITSTTDGQHIETSFHYEGRAFDIRTHRIPKTLIRKYADEIRETLIKKVSKCFQVIIEETHIHIEFDYR